MGRAGCSRGSRSIGGTTRSSLDHRVQQHRAMVITSIMWWAVLCDMVEKCSVILPRTLVYYE
eukprot:SAG25_NODE_748_length_5580_cov_2.245576_1_plen_61_part_10